MKTTTYNEIKALIDATDNPTEVATFLRQLLAEAKIKIDAHQKAVAQKEREEKVKALKSLKPQSAVYTRELGGLFGKKLFKIKDGKERMLVGAPNGRWRIPYGSLQIEPLNEMELRLGKIITR